MEDSHLLPEAEFTAAKVEQAVLQMYKPYSSQSGQGPQLNTFLSQAQSSPAAWRFSLDLLCPDKLPEVQFFGAQCLHAKVSCDWHELKASQHNNFRSWLKYGMQQFADSARYVVSKLHQVIATMAIQQRAVSKEAPNPVDYVLGFYTTKEMETPQKCDCYHSMLDILTQLPKEAKEYGRVRMLKQTRSEIHCELQKAVPQVMTWLKDLLDQKATLPELCVKRIFRCFGSWLEVKLEPEDMMPLTERVFLALLSADTFEVAADVVVEVFGCISIQRHPQTLHRLLELVNGLQDLGIAALRLNNMDTLSTLCRIMVAAAESDPGELFNMLQKEDKDRKTATLLLECIMTFAFPPGQYLVQEKVSDISLSFWMVLQDIVMDLDVSSEDSRQEEVVELLRLVYMKLMEELVTKVQYPEEQCWAGWGHEQHDAYEDYRQQIRDTATCCFDVLQEEALQYLYESLQTLVERSNNRLSIRWQEVEAIFTVLGSMGQAADLPDSPYLPDIMRLLPSVQFPNPTLLSSAIYLIGAFCEWLGGHEDVLQAVFPLVLQGLQHRASTSTAVLTLHHLVKETLQGVQPFVPHILTTAQEILGSDRQDPEDCLRLMFCVGRVLSGLPVQDVQSCLQTLLGPRLTHMHQLIMQEPTGAEEGQLVFEVKLLSQLFSGLHTKGLEEGKGEEEVMDGMELQQSPNMVYEILQRIFPTLKDLVRMWKHRPAMVEAVSEMFVQSLTVLGREFRPLAESVADMIHDMYEATPHAAVLHLIGEIVEQFKADATFTMNIALLVNSVCSNTILSFDKIMEDPSVLQTFNIVMSTMLKQCRDVLLSSGTNLEDLLKVGVNTMKLQLTSVVESGYYLTTGFLRLSTEDERLTAAIHNSMPFIVGTVMEVICSRPGLCVLELMADLLQVCCKNQLQSFAAVLKHYLSQDHPYLVQVTNKDKDYFVQLLIRNHRDRIKCRELVKEFALKCHGVSKPGQGRQLSSS